MCSILHEIELHSWPDKLLVFWVFMKCLVLPLVQSGLRSPMYKSTVHVGIFLTLHVF